MLKAFFLPLAILILLAANGQNKKSIEVSFIGRYDRHANYVSNFAGRAYNDTNKLYGTSYGANVSYRQKTSKSISISFGIGYYKLNVEKIRGSMPFNIPGIRTVRNIDYDDGMTNLLYSTSKYHYNNLAVTVGVNKTVSLRKRWYFDISAEGIGYYTFSQRYLLFDGPDKYSTRNSKPLEFGINVTAGILKEFNKFYIRPALLMPVYQRLKGDKVFFEDKKMNISKWFEGMGAAIRIGKYI
ncbi:MAG: hypothetical protein WDN26_24030 [Chitinophagaceae bacterium]